MSLIIDGQVVATNSPRKEVTSAQYSALSYAEKTNGTSYFITDDADPNQQRISSARSAIGTESDLADLGYSTIIAAIVALHNQINNTSFTVSNSTSGLEVTNNNTTPSGAPDVTAFENDEAAMSHILNTIGNTSVLSTLGYTSIIDAIQQLSAEVG